MGCVRQRKPSVLLLPATKYLKLTHFLDFVVCSLTYIFENVLTKKKKMAMNGRQANPVPAVIPLSSPALLAVSGAGPESSATVTIK